MEMHNIAWTDDILWSDVAINYANDKTTVYNDIKAAVQYIHVLSEAELIVSNKVMFLL